jgi:hypothetical protein
MGLDGESTESWEGDGHGEEAEEGEQQNWRRMSTASHAASWQLHLACIVEDL